MSLYMSYQTAMMEKFIQLTKDILNDGIKPSSQLKFSI